MSIFKKRELTKLIELLLEYIDINCQDSLHMTALMYAAQYSLTDSSDQTVKFLLENKANPNIHDKSTALLLACKYLGISSTITTIELLIQYGADICATDIYGNTTLMYVLQGDPNQDLNQAVDLLLNQSNKDILLNARNEKEMSTLMYAVQNKHTLLLLETFFKNVDWNQQDVNGMSVLMYAALHKNIHLTLLCCNTIDVNIVDDEGNSALMYCIQMFTSPTFSKKNLQIKFSKNFVKMI